MTENFRYTFKLERIKLDSRDFRQDSDSFIPHTPLYVSVDLPRENEYVLNLSDISDSELSSNNKGIPEPVLTPKGYAFIKRSLELGFIEPKTKNEDWNDVVEAEKKLEQKNVDDDWGNTVDTEKSLNPEKVAPAENDWGKSPFETDKAESETWEDEKEQW